MQALGVNWIIEGTVDFEYKKYILLAYLQEINRHFDKVVKFRIGHCFKAARRNKSPVF